MNDDLSMIENLVDKRVGGRFSSGTVPSFEFHLTFENDPPAAQSLELLEGRVTRMSNYDREGREVNQDKMVTFERSCNDIFGAIDHCRRALVLLGRRGLCVSRAKIETSAATTLPTRYYEAHLKFSDQPDPKRFWRHFRHRERVRHSWSWRGYWWLTARSRNLPDLVAEWSEMRRLCREARLLPLEQEIEAVIVDTNPARDQHWMTAHPELSTTPGRRAI